MICIFSALSKNAVLALKKDVLLYRFVFFFWGGGGVMAVRICRTAHHEFAIRIDYQKTKKCQAPFFCFRLVPLRAELNLRRVCQQVLFRLDVPQSVVAGADFGQFCEERVGGAFGGKVVNRRQLQLFVGVD